MFEVIFCDKSVALAEITYRNKKTYKNFHIYILKKVWIVIFYITARHTLSVNLSKTYLKYTKLLPTFRLILQEHFLNKKRQQIKR